MAELTFYTNPMSRGQTVRWMLEEVGEPYQTEFLDFGPKMKNESYLSINPMGKVPAIRHNGRVVTEVAAICCYLADAFPEANLAPPPPDRADYYRWIFFTSGPIEAAFTNRSMGWEAPTEKQAMLGYGSYQRAIDTLENYLAGKPYVTCGRFTAADLFIGAMLGFMIQFKLVDPRPAFTDYVARVTDRDAYRRASAIDGKLIAEMQAKQQSQQEPAQ